jgi:DNA-binding MarR family transcriptional regulator
MGAMDAEAAAAEFAELFGKAYRRFYRRVPVGQYRLTSESIAALQHLVETGPLTVAEAARHLKRSQSAMSEMLDRLERRNLVARIADERDRRRTLVWLTDEGQDALDEAQRVLSEGRLREAFDGLDQTDRVRLIEAMRLLIDAPVHYRDERGRDLK